MASNSIKKVNLQQMQRPKTLIVIHYRGKRVSIPIFESMDNIVQYLWHQLQKFQNTILQAETRTKNNRHSSTITDIVGFSCFQHQKNKLDIKMNILLSMSRLGKDYGQSRTDMKQLDITNYYKYLEIQPYYGFNSKELIPEYQLYSVLATGQYFTTYLGRKVSDGRFYSIKICRSDSKLAFNEYNAMKIIHNEQLKFDKKNLQIIPQVDQVRKTDGLFIFIYQYCPGGNLKYAIRNKLSQIQCLHYMKQLIWGIHTLNTNFNLIHRALCFDHLEIDFVGNLRLVNYAYCQPCYANSYFAHSNVPESYQERYEIPYVASPPQVQRSGKYNHLVDYFGVGVVLQEMFIPTGINKIQLSRQKQGIQIAIQNLTAQNIRDRQLFINQVISQLHEQKMKSYSNRSKSVQTIQHQRLTFNKIYTGQSINIEQKTYNGIRHQQALRIMKPSTDDHLYFLNPVNKSRKKSKDKSKSKEKGKDGKQKVKEKSKSKSKSKDKEKDYKGSLHNMGGTTKLGLNKKLKNGSEKSLNKSIDSRNHSAKSNKSSESRQKKKQAIQKNTQHEKRLIPKIPTPNNIPNIKSPPKNSTMFTNIQQNHRSPPKLITNKSKNKL